MDATPVLGTNKATPEVSRDRVLRDAELKLVWEHAGEGDFGDIIRLLILTGQRREEVAAMDWVEVDLDGTTWRIAGERTKNSRPHEVPLAQRALQLLAVRPRHDGRALVFGSRGPFSGWSKAKAALDARISAARFGEALLPWRLHDIRRTVATRLADLGVLPHVVEAVLNHASGHKAGVAGVYNRPRSVGASCDRARRKLTTQQGQGATEQAAAVQQRLKPQRSGLSQFLREHCAAAASRSNRIRVALDKLQNLHICAFALVELQGARAD